jgi:lipopolysaccharide/colanic/teichoic acid biosynthesis glycosyltransferase
MPDISEKVTKDVDYVAQWKENTDIKYTVRYVNES